MFGHLPLHPSTYLDFSYSRAGSVLRNSICGIYIMEVPLEAEELFYSLPRTQRIALEYVLFVVL